MTTLRMMTALRMITAVRMMNRLFTREPLIETFSHSVLETLTKETSKLLRKQVINLQLTLRFTLLDEDSQPCQFSL